MKLSVIIPCYNEKATIKEVVNRVKRTHWSKEIIIVDDGSTDGTKQLLETMKSQDLKVIFQPINQGKGAAIKAGLSQSTGNYIIIQDADLEYDPEDWEALIKPIQKGVARVVYGSRFTGKHRNMFFCHWFGNKFLTFITDLLYNTTISDMETGYKIFASDIIKSIRLRSNRFDFEPEVTAKILKKGVRIYEVPISYAGREFREGKKITWKDGFVAFYTLIKYRFFD